MNDKVKTFKQTDVSMKPTLAKTKKMAQELTKFITDNNLTANIAGKQYVMVEGWEFAGSQLGLGNTIEDVQNQSSDKEIKYFVKAEVRHLTTGNLVSSGYAVCSNQEKSKKSFDEYAILSMAQTRAIGKAYRNTLAWLIKAAGFEPTPVEEIDRDDLETRLGKAKQKIVAKMKTMGINDSQEMMAQIQQAIGKGLVETIDEADKVMRHLDKD